MEVSQGVEERPMPQNESSTDWPFSYFKFDRGRDSADQVRNAILVVAALVATASFQAVMNPPDSITSSTRYKRIVFVCANTLAWSSSITIIEKLTASFPFQVEFRLSYISMGFAYGFTSAVVADVTFGPTYVLLLLCFVTPSLIRWVPTYIKRKCC